jgi:hypothetical protein
MAIKTEARLDISTAPLAVALREAQETHELLKNKLQFFRGDFDETLDERATFIAQVRCFLDSLRPHCERLRTTAQYEQISNIADEWQTLLTEILREPIDVRDVIGLKLPANDLTPSPRRLPLHEVQQTLKRRALETAQFRKLAQLFAQIDWLYRWTKSPEMLHQRYPSTHQEMEQDWSYACQFLAADVLEGRLRIADQLNVDAFDFLTETWLDDTKRLMAYIRWFSDVNAAEPSALARMNDGRYYFNVCESLHNSLRDDARKAPPELFCDIGAWIQRQYPSSDVVSAPKGSPSWKLISRKAQRIWERTGRTNADANWRQAEDYVRGYYEHIIPAVIDRSQDSIQSVLAAVTPQREETAGCEIINTFEAAVAIEFLDPTVISAHYRPERSYL